MMRRAPVNDKWLEHRLFTCPDRVRDSVETSWESTAYERVKLRVVERLTLVVLPESRRLATDEIQPVSPCGLLRRRRLLRRTRHLRLPVLLGRCLLLLKGLLRRLLLRGLLLRLGMHRATFRRFRIRARFRRDVFCVMEKKIAAARLSRSHM